MRPIDLALSKLRDARQSGAGWVARCPAHDDRTPSLSVHEGDDGRVLIRCHTGCETEKVVAAMGLEMKDLFTPDRNGQANGRGAVGEKSAKRARKTYPTVEVASAAALEMVRRQRGDGWSNAHVHVYRDPEGRELMRVLRFERAQGNDKTFVPIHPSAGGWQIGDPPKPLPLYRLFENKNRGTVSVFEGELCADRAALLGYAATTSAHGANSPQNSDWSLLICSEVEQINFFSDFDITGRKYIERVMALLRDRGCMAVFKVVELPGLPEGGDIVEFLDGQRAVGKTDEEIRATIDALIAATPPEPLPQALAASKPSPARTSRAPNYIPFPTHLLPEPLRDFVLRCSEAIGCDPAFIALPALAAAASAIGNTRRIRLKSGWSEPAILWVILLSLSGKQKTPAFAVIHRAIDELQRRSLQKHAEDMKRYEAKVDAYEVRRRKWISEGGEGEPPPKPDEPIPDRLYASDTTIEALAMLLFHRWRGLLLLRDELSGWIAGFDQYHQGKGSDVAYWLEMHGGRAILIDRKTGKPKTIHVPRAAVSIAGSVQPRVLGRILGSKHFENGLAARFLPAYPPRRPRRWTENDIPPECEENLLRIFERLYELREDTGKDGVPTPREIDLTPEAKRLWVKFFNAHGEEQDAMTGDLSAAWSKLEGYAARLALVIHYLRWAGGDAEADPCIDEASIRAGIELSRWFGNETKRVYAILRESEEEQRDRELVEIIRARGGEVTVRTWQRLRSTPSAEAAEVELQDLVERGHGTWVHSSPLPQGGRPTKVFRPHTEGPGGETPRDDEPIGVSSVSEPDAGDGDAHEEQGEKRRDQSSERHSDSQDADDPSLTSDRTTPHVPGMEVSPDEKEGAATPEGGIPSPRPSPESALGSDTDRTPPAVIQAGVSNSASLLDQVVETFGGSVTPDPPPPRPATRPRPTRPSRPDSTPTLGFDGEQEVPYD